MGMFDNIRCKVPLPVVGLAYAEHWFQTKSLENVLGAYEIREDGLLWERHAVEHPQREVWLKSAFTGQIKFCTSSAGCKVAESDNTFWIEFSAAFVEGSLRFIQLNKRLDSQRAPYPVQLDWLKSYAVNGLQLPSIHPLVRRDEAGAPYRRIAVTNTCILYPEHWPKYFNGVGSTPCDLLQGPCCCGAWHSLNEWEIDTSSQEEAT